MRVICRMLVSKRVIHSLVLSSEAVRCGIQTLLSMKTALRSIFGSLILDPKNQLLSYYGSMEEVLSLGQHLFISMTDESWLLKRISSLPPSITELLPWDSCSWIERMLQEMLGCLIRGWLLSGFRITLKLLEETRRMLLSLVNLPEPSLSVSISYLP